jgi:hypothetical protein
MLPSLRAFARDALPGVRSTPAALDATTPLLRQTRQLFSESELKGLSRDLRQAIPDLTRLNRSQIPFLEQGTMFASCNNEVVQPFLRTPIPDPDFPEMDDSLVREQLARAGVGLAGESRTGDANGQWFRAAARSGGSLNIATGEEGDDLLTPLPNDAHGMRPSRPKERPEFRPDVPCETQEPPDLKAPKGQFGDAEDLPSIEELLERAGVREAAEKRLRALFGQDPDAGGIVPFAPAGED